MKKNFKLEDLDCANCAMKMERAIAKIDGVDAVSVNFMAQRMTIDVIMEKVVKACRKVEPDCKIIK